MDISIPNHLAIIPDGNRRWAKKHGKLPWLGHKAGFTRFHEVSEEAFLRGTNYVTIWGASVDNLKKRSRQEVSYLMLYMRQELAKKKLSDYCHKNQIRFRVIGQWHKVIKDYRLSVLIDRLEKQTRDFVKRRLTMLFGYDGVSEMLYAAKHLSVEEQRELDYETFKKKLWTKDLPQVDLVVRTGGEPHWSAGFMMWHSINSQLYFTETLWPDFDSRQLQKAYDDYGARERRFGR